VSSPITFGRVALLLLVVACGPKQNASGHVEAMTVGAVSQAAPPSTSPAPEPTVTSEAEPEPPPPEPPPIGSPEAAECIQRSKLSHCLALFGPTMDAPRSLSDGASCTSSCIGNRDKRLSPAVERAGRACVGAYVKSRGAAAPKCEFPRVVTPRDPRELSMRFQDALRSAVERRDEATARALDKMLESLDATYLAGVEPECTKKCREDGAAALTKR
jgi:hypothetical protein